MPFRNWKKSTTASTLTRPGSELLHLLGPDRRRRLPHSFDCDDFSRRALYTLLDNVQEIQNDHNKNLAVSGIVVNQFQPRANLPQQLVQELIDEGLPVLQPYLSSSVKIRESHQLSADDPHGCPPQAHPGNAGPARVAGQLISAG